MSQVFSADSVTGAQSAVVVTTSETPLVTGNFLNPPFGNAKAHLTAMVVLAVGAGTGFVSIRVRRNPNGENLVVASSTGVSATAGFTQFFTCQGADVIPDGRPVQYQVTVQQGGATGNGSVEVASVAALLISG